MSKIYYKYKITLINGYSEHWILEHKLLLNIIKNHKSISSLSIKRTKI